MARAYRRAKGGRPVPYPDQSGRMLNDEIVIGSDWEPFVALEYIEPIDGDVDPGMFTDGAYFGSDSPVMKPARKSTRKTVMERAAEEKSPEPDLSVMEKAALTEDKTGDRLAAEE